MSGERVMRGGLEPSARGDFCSSLTEIVTGSCVREDLVRFTRGQEMARLCKVLLCCSGYGGNSADWSNFYPNFRVFGDWRRTHAICRYKAQANHIQYKEKWTKSHY